MKYSLTILIITLSTILLFGGTDFQPAGFLSAAFAQPQPPEKSWTGKTADGQVITQGDLNRVLASHKKWLETNGKKEMKADLSRADLTDANLTDAKLTDGNLFMADLSGANLGRANLNRADLSDAKLNDANLFTADLIRANLSRAHLGRANLIGADLRWAKLGEAFLLGADLSSVDLRWADLSRATLLWDHLIGGDAILNGADLSGTVFEHVSYTPPKVDSIANVRGLANLRYKESSQSLVKLRKAFKEAGYRQQEWEITCSLKRSDTWQDWRKGGIDRIKAAFNYVFFDLTCNYGISPWRPMALLSIFVLIFSPFYCLALKSRRPDTGIWLTWLPNRVLMDEGQERPVKLTTSPPFDPPVTGKWARVWWHLRGIWRILCLGLYFSLVSAFSLGWKELNVGNWISRIQKKEYILRPTGWVRTVAGIHSLISAFLLALWAFLYVGSIFESK